MGIIEKMRLDGKKIFVTGGARGIGKSVATAFAQAGADLAIVDIDIEEARKTAKELEEENGIKAIAIQTDVSNPEQVDAMVKGVVDTFGKLDAAFCNAGICMNVPAEEMTFEQWNEMVPMGRMGRPEELQSICVYLAGDTSSFTTGSDFVIDGAFTCF